MCGFAGIASRHSYPPVELSRLVSMRDTLQHRGPDDAGCFLAAGIALASRRLAVLDLSPRGRMPMTSSDARYTIAYNGEVYNYRDLRHGAAAKGYRFQSDTDTEVLLALYEQRGAEMLELLNGMFAIAIWDATEQTLFLARDRLGVKPLYYYKSPDSLIFGSEEKALFDAGVPAEFDSATLAELLCFRYVAGRRTPFRGIERLLPGHYLTWKRGHLSIRTWWRLGDAAPASPPNAASWYRDTFDDSVALRTISDVPVGVLLSGGLDSSSVASSLAARSPDQLSSFTVRFPESPRHDEGPAAAAFAQHCGLNHHETVVKGEDLMPLLHEATWLNDEPLAHANAVHLLAVSRYAKNFVTVLLSGEGGDETLGGYVRYRLLRTGSWIPRMAFPEALLDWNGLPRRFYKTAQFLQMKSLDERVLMNSCDVFPSELREAGCDAELDLGYRTTVLDGARKLYPGDLLRQGMFYDQQTFLCSVLDRNDRMTMGASIECRVPFLDYRIVEQLARMDSRDLFTGSGTKPLLRRAMRSRLTPDTLRHKKWGFGVPWSEHLRRVPEFQDLVVNLPSQPLIRDYFDPRLLRRAVASFLLSDGRHEALILQLVMLAIWGRMVSERHGSPQQPLLISGEARA
ncbi:MAG: asparagine synthase (glutamine-hydrolyzing) [Bryobacteraceae bacterium]|nr:asparagine synthase (glutamine-hydrolyzing) [Bryobacteraceae bacterium]